MNKIILGLDLDGVLYDFHAALHTYYQYQMGYNGTFSEFWTDYIPSLGAQQQQYIMAVPIPYEIIAPSDDVINFLRYIEDKCEVYYITHRPIELERITRRYLRRYDFPYQDNLIMTDDKVSACRLYGVTHFIDDFPKQVELVSAVAKSYLRARIHNRDFQDTMNTVYSLAEFRQAVFND